jgi:hypothetical protein
VSLANSSEYRQFKLYDGLPVTTQNAKGLPRPLAERSAIDPFIVMDVMGEANARELSGDDIIHMNV